ncbi:MAG: alpha-glucosidase [Betaproteobacteria bacterium]|nr:alpha-glucosidase [Betaproteobacteria bacterium]
MRVEGAKDGLRVRLGDIVLVEHSTDEPAFFAGIGEPESNLHRGNFKVLDRRLARFALELIALEVRDGLTVAAMKRRGATAAEVTITFGRDGENIGVELHGGGLNRFWIRLNSEPGEHLWGGGEQFSHFSLAGRRFPMWTQEPGVGRDLTTRMALIAENDAKAGAHEAATYYPQPTFASSRRYALHVDSPAYSVLDFTSPMFHEIEVWDTAFRFELFAGSGLEDLVCQLARRFGHGGHLPEWVYNGAILGLKRGTARNFEILEQALAAGVHVSGMWSEDWCGLRHTSFGARLFWDWQWSAQRYPELPAKIRELKERGIRFLVYNNPNLCSDGPLFKEAAEKGVLAKNPDGSICTIDFGEFDCGFVDFTSEAGRQWYKDRIIKRSMLDLGVSGWMADFGEYLPTDVRVASGEDGWKVHNQWPALWARVNAEAIAEAGLADEILFFMRAGYTGSQKYCKLMWAGDQLVDFSRHDGLETAISAALSCGVVGNTVSHSDIGGYTTLYGNVRTEEVFMRWAEMNAFTPVMRTHESNRPDESFQFYQSATALAHFARMTRIYRALVPYLKTLSAEAVATGLPTQRPLALHYEADRATWAIHDQYLYGRELLVAPVHKSGMRHWRAYLPRGETWVHLWSGAAHEGGQVVEVAAPFGQIPVFYRQGSAWEDLFVSLRAL